MWLLLCRKDWAADPFTATAADRTSGNHPLPGHGLWDSDQWAERLLMAGSETSASEPGYLAGAIETARRAVEEFLCRLEMN